MSGHILNQQGRPIGPSVGWLAAKISPLLNEQSEILAQSGATAAELVWGDARRNDAICGTDLEGHITYRALHFGSFCDFTEQHDARQEAVFRKVKAAFGRHNFHGSSIHPDTTPRHVYRRLAELGIPLGIENMDRLKPNGKTVEEIQGLVQEHSAAGVLDLQHCFEIAKDTGQDFVEFARQFAQLMRAFGGVRHLHVSGEIFRDGRQHVSHAQLTDATNREEILNALRAVLDITGSATPIILEGDPLLRFDFLQPGQDIDPNTLLERKVTAVTNIAKEINLINEALKLRAA